MKDRTEQEQLALELANKMKGWLCSLQETHDLCVSDVGDMERLLNKLFTTFSFSHKATSESGDLRPICWDDFLFDDDPLSFKHQKSLKEVDNV